MATGKVRTAKARTKKPVTKKPTKPTARYTKNDALRDAMRGGGGTGDAIVAAMDRLYVEHGGKSNPDGTRLHLDLTLPVLVSFGVVERDDSGAYRPAAKSSWSRGDLKR